ncbi:MAG: ribbon-helix-helix domain-containing protein [Candidatus Melainabacteria bacterium]|jgi:hypothetical protein|nr:ribbon-helix-helix domain-containing protein [Candidatus Melainabacteria bacterium]
MAIAKRPNSSTKDTLPKTDDRAAQAFISGAGRIEEEAETDRQRKPVMIRFAPDLLANVDKAAKKRGISRSAWIQFVLSQSLEKGKG